MMKPAVVKVRRDEKNLEAKEELALDIVVMAKIALKNSQYDVYKRLVAEAKLQNIDIKTGQRLNWKKRQKGGLVRSCPSLAVLKQVKKNETKDDYVDDDDISDLPEVSNYLMQAGPSIWPAYEFPEPEETTSNEEQNEEQSEGEGEAMDQVQELETKREPQPKPRRRDVGVVSTRLTPHEKNKKEMYTIYHKLKTNENVPLVDSPRTLYLKECGVRQVVPEPLGLTHGSNMFHSKMNLSYYGIGNEHANVLSTALRKLPHLRTLDLRQNRLSGPVLSKLLSNVRDIKLRVIDLSENVLSSDGAIALAKLIQTSESVRVLKLNNANISLDGIKRLCQSLRRKNVSLRSLHLSDNNLSERAADALGDMLMKNKSLTALNLSWNKISGQNSQLLMEGLRGNKVLETLDLRWNLLGHKSNVEYLGRALSKNRSLTHLDLSYNCLGKEQCKALSASLNLNNTLLGLHMAGNASKVSPSGYLVGRKQAAFSEAMAEHRRVLRSYASICNGEKRVEKTKRNTIRQTALDGATAASNKRRMNSFRSAVLAVSSLAKTIDGPEKGRASVVRNVLEKQGTENMLNAPKSKHKIMDTLSRQGAAEVECNNCWICGGWREVRIEFVDYSSAEEVVVKEVERKLKHQEEQDSNNAFANNPYKLKVQREKTTPTKNLPPPLEVFVHLSCDGFAKPRRLRYIKGDFKYELYVMLPPGLCEFYFTVEIPGEDGPRDRQKVSCLAMGQHTSKSSEKAEHLYWKAIKGQRLGRKIPRVWHGRDESNHLMRGSAAGMPSSDELRLHAMHVLARDEKGLPDTLQAKPRSIGTVARKQGWSKENSVFASYQEETTDFVVKSFHADVAQGKYHRFVKDEAERHDLLTVLQENYALLRIVYQLFCANSTGTSVSSVSWNAFTDLCQTCNIPDINCQQKDLDTIFVATNVNESEGVTKDPTGKNLNPDRDLCRYELVEIIARIAIYKFVRPGIVESPALALRKLVDENLIPYLDIENPQIFRDRFLWQESTDKLFKNYLPTLTKLFRRIADTDMNRKNKRLSVKAWRGFLAASGVFNEGGCCTERDAKLCYRLCMISVVDEMTTDSHLTITFVEFLEALGRTAYLCDLGALENYVKSFERDFEKRKTRLTLVAKQRRALLIAEGRFEGSLEEETDGEEEEESEYSSSEDEDGGEEEEDVGQVKSLFPRKLALLLRLLIWHPCIYDRTGMKSKLNDKMHDVLLKQRPSVAVPALLAKGVADS